MLNFDPRWRRRPPADGTYINSVIPTQAFGEFVKLIDSMSTPKTRWDVLEHFKAAFGTSSTSSSESWAESDLLRAMDNAAKNAPLFIAQFYAGCNELTTGSGYISSAADISEICQEHNVGYYIDPPELISREKNVAVAMPQERSQSLSEVARSILNASVERSQALLDAGQHREAVSELLWILESVATAFKGDVKGKYFNTIIRELQQKEERRLFSQALRWLETLHGYLSSPTGGGVRHGADLAAGDPLGANDARLICNLIRSYLEYLLSEHHRLTKSVT